MSWIGAAYDRHAAGLFRYAVVLLGDPAAAADAVHQVFVKLLSRPADVLNLEPVDRAAADTVQQVEVEQALRALPAEQREVVHLKVFEGMTFQEIADTTGESINTIAGRYRYAMVKLRALLQGVK